ncbi:MAG: tRNA uridine-5-carboxymethylaminomethyl(34) synthesis enzyme MnmG [Phycisphaerales bacterium]|nr:tRNA uridine-5-carboxymethylaminomethyl(34) synthesis enzyme MnmG [Phycisphaerales bacterium]
MSDAVGPFGNMSSVVAEPLEAYDVVVIGGGHAGVEACWAAASAIGPEGRVALVTMDPSKIGVMSCNPAIGGLGKGQIVREIDALGGVMGRAADATGIMFKMLNTSKGAAVRGPRCQNDKYEYAREVQRLIAGRSNIDIIAACVDELLVEKNKIVGVQLELANQRSAQVITDAVVLTTGTFMRALMHTGQQSTPGGRVGEGSAVGIAHTLAQLGFELGRLKTGTPPRLDRATIDWEGLVGQRGDENPIPFSDLSPASLPGGRFPAIEQTECRITSTTAQMHDLIRENLDKAPMYSGQIDASAGPRYCPSIEDKVVRFADREEHHIFLEPESLSTNEVYCNGISTSLPKEVQAQFLSMMPGCEHARVLRYGYAVEYDMVWPHQIDSTTMTKKVDGLFLAGQINGTSGYEEAAGQGLVAGLNSARWVVGGHEAMIRLGRDQAYIGVMLDDLVTKTPREPYRMFTSRAEHRLLLRADNSDQRLTPLGREFGLVCDRRWHSFQQRAEAQTALHLQMESNFIEGKSLMAWARRPDLKPEQFRGYLVNAGIDPPSSDIVQRVVTEARYDGYLKRQAAEIRRREDGERRAIPAWLEAHTVKGLRGEAAEAIARFQPATLGQAARLAGVGPADVTLLAVAIRRGRAASTGTG